MHKVGTQQISTSKDLKKFLAGLLVLEKVLIAIKL